MGGGELAVHTGSLTQTAKDMTSISDKGTKRGHHLRVEPDCWLWPVWIQKSSTYG